MDTLTVMYAVNERMRRGRFELASVVASETECTATQTFYSLSYPLDTEITQKKCAFLALKSLTNQWC